MRLLLDVNVWVALLDDAHVFSEQANALIETRGVRIATCPLIENGVIRVMNSPSYGRRGAVGLRVVRQRLQEACRALDHEFWPDDLSLRDDDRVDFDRIHGPSQLTDVYLLALATEHGGSLASLPVPPILNASSMPLGGGRRIHSLVVAMPIEPP